MILSINVINSGNSQPLPGATVELWAGNVLVKRLITDNGGVASVNVVSLPDMVRITNVEFIPAEIRLQKGANSYQVKLQRIVKDIEGVTVLSVLKKSGWLWLIILGVVIIAENTKK